MDAVARRPVLIAVMLAAFAAEAAPDAEAMREAGRRFKAGDQAYKLGDYATAIAAFEDAYRLSEDPIVLFNIAQSYRKQYGADSDRQRLIRARDLYRTFLREGTDAGMRSQAEGLLAEVEKLLAETEQAAVAPPPPVPQVSTDPTVLPPAALPRTDAEASAASDEATAGSTPWYKRPWVWVAAGVVAAAAGGGVFLATRGGSEPAGEFCPGGCKTANVPVK